MRLPIELQSLPLKLEYPIALLCKPRLSVNLHALETLARLWIWNQSQDRTAFFHSALDACRSYSLGDFLLSCSTCTCDAHVLRVAIRRQPFLWPAGILGESQGTLWTISHSVRALRPKNGDRFTAVKITGDGVDEKIECASRSRSFDVFLIFLFVFSIPKFW